MEKDVPRSQVGIYSHNLKNLILKYIMPLDQPCPNFSVCQKMYDSRLKVCTSCFWRFKNEVLHFNDDTCPLCLTYGECVKFRKCEHFVCIKCCKRHHKCPLCKIKTC